MSLKVRLFNDVAGETYTELATIYSREIHLALRPIFERAKRDNVCLRELESIGMGEVMLLTSEMALRAGSESYKAKQKAKEFQGTANCPSNPSPNLDGASN